MEDYAGRFDPDFRLEKLSRAALARLGREYLLFGHIRDRGLMPAVAARFGAPATEEIAILEWMGASPHYTRRMRRALRIEGDDVTAIMKSLQLDVGFPHRYMDVGYEIESEQVGYFWLASCGALLDVEPFGEKAVTSMCHAIEDPTFDATAFATNPRARVRPIHRPPRQPGDRVPHCRWRISIDPANDPVAEPPITRAVGACALVDFELDAPVLEDDDGRPDYAGPFDPELRLEKLSQRALVLACKEFMLQSQLLARSSMLALTEYCDEKAARELLMTQWLAIAPLSTQRICKAMAIPVADADADAAAVLKMLQVHPLLPHDYLRLGFELDGPEHARFWVEDCAALRDAEPRGFLSLLDDPACPGLNAMVQAVNPRARCRRLDSEIRLAWAIEIDASAEAAGVPAEAGFVRRSTVSGAELE